MPVAGGRPAAQPSVRWYNAAKPPSDKLIPGAVRLHQYAKYVDPGSFPEIRAGDLRFSESEARAMANTAPTRGHRLR